MVDLEFISEINCSFLSLPQVIDITIIHYNLWLCPSRNDPFVLCKIVLKVFHSNVNIFLCFKNGESRAFPFSCCYVDDDVEDPRKLAEDKVKNITACYERKEEYFQGQVSLL